MKPPVFEESWSEEVKQVYAHDRQEIWDRSIAPHIFNMYRNQLDMYKSLVPKGAKDIIDVGCAQATLALQLAEDGYDVTAVDIRREFLDYAKSRWTHGNITFLEGNIFEISISKTFDVVFANQILEHLVYPSTFVEKLAQLLKPNGLMVVTTPNGEYVKSDLPAYSELGDPREWEHMQFTADGDGHFFAYTKDELVEILRKAGLRSVKCTHYETPWISGHMKFRYIHNTLPYPVLRALDGLTRSLPFGNRFSHQLLAIGIR